MPDASNRAARYRDLADECLKRSQLASDGNIRAHYRRIAESYLVVARAELTRAEQNRTRQGLLHPAATVAGEMRHDVY